MDKAFFLNGGAGRILTAIPALEKNIQKNSNNIVIAEAWPELYLMSPILRDCSYVPNTKNLFEDKLLKDKLKNRNINLYQTDQSFYQPNHFHMPKMVQKASDFIKEPKDLLELYCGSGTFTLPLARIFRNVIATENNRQSIKCLNKSINEHSIKNVFHFRLSAEEVADALEGRIFKRMGKTNIKDFNFSHILVDPPRSGLTEDVINLLNKFQNIIYISCNQHTYARDLDLLNNFTISDIEFFDQFPNTDHLEIVSLLTKK